MGRRYTHLTIEDRCEPARRHAAGALIRQIAARLDRAPTTMARELNRNSSRTLGYQPRYADQQARARRWRGPRLDREPALRGRVLRSLQQGWSPEQVAGRLARETGRPVISYDTIYRFIDAQIRRTKNYSWRHFLPQAKAKRGRRSRKGRNPAATAHRSACQRGRSGLPGALGGEPAAVPHLWVGRPDAARAPLPLAHRHPAARQGRRPHRAGPLAARLATDRHL